MAIACPGAGPLRRTDPEPEMGKSLPLMGLLAADVTLRGRKEGSQSLQERARVERLTLPHQQQIPSQCFQLPLIAPVSLGILRKFRGPELRPRLGGRCAGTPSMPMPETAMNEDGLSEPGKN
jgi:hypothetical protein